MNTERAVIAVSIILLVLCILAAPYIGQTGPNQQVETVK